MEKKWLEIESPVNVAGVTIITVIKNRYNYWLQKGSVSFLCTREPVNIVVISGDTEKAFHIDGEEVSLEEMMAENPELQQIIGKTGSTQS